jgi:Immunoglobulin-like domain of bacterial spore germination
MSIRPWLALLALPALLGCSLVSRGLNLTAPATERAGAPTEVPFPSLPAAGPQPTGPVPGTAEAITIREPGPGSRLVNAILLRGMVTIPTFENGLTARVVWDDGTDAIPPTPITVVGDVGQTGTFEVRLSFTVSGERNAFIQVYAVSPRDGGVIHLTSSGVRLAEGGANQVVITPDEPERLSLLMPTTGATIGGGTAHVQGFGLAGFEQTLLIEVLDTSGAILGSQSVQVQAPDLGQPGPFQADVAYEAASAGAGRIVVRDVSPAFGGDTHLASVEVHLGS